jgi:hypothetical protein
VLVGNKTAIELLRAQAAGDTFDVGAVQDAFVQVVLELDERVSSLENSAPGAALANLRWRHMSQPERQATLDAAKAQRKIEGHV